MTTHTRASWLVYVLGALTAGAVVVAVLVVGPASGSQASATRTATVAKGVVQSTVSGSGTLQARDESRRQFRHERNAYGGLRERRRPRHRGELLAEINPSSAESSLRSAEIALTTDEASYQDAVEGLTPAEQRQARHQR